jgi:hypothetical protein
MIFKKNKCRWLPFLKIDLDTSSMTFSVISRMTSLCLSIALVAATGTLAFAQDDDAFILIVCSAEASISGTPWTDHGREPRVSRSRPTIFA